MNRLMVLALGVLTLAAAVSGHAEEAVEGATGGGERRVLLLQISGSINPASAEYIRDGIARGVEEGATAVIIRLDTPGGLLDSTKEIVKDLLGASVPTVVYVGPSGGGAISAGVFVTMAAHVAAMAPGTNIGAAHPVTGQGGDIEGDMGDKVENFAASLSRTIAQKRGRNVEWAEQAVRESVSITESEALDLRVVDIVARDVDDLLAQLDGREVELEGGARTTLHTASAEVEHVDMRLRQKLLDALANPTLAYLFLMAGLLGLYVEFTHPGVFFPGVAGAICLLIAMAALQILPINYSGLALVALGVTLLIAEAFVPSFGVLGFGGLAAFVLGSLLLFETPESTLTIHRGLVGGIAAALGMCFLLIGWLVVSAQRRPVVGGAEGMVGEIGEVRRLVGGNRAKVFVHGETWDATVEGSVAEGDEVEVVAVDGLRVRVRARSMALT
jgi:membrane-bound serine protease (ClpP class)